MNTNFQTMPLEELRQYVLTHREEDQPFSIYIARLQSSNTPRRNFDLSTAEGEAEFKQWIESKQKQD